MIAIEIAHRIFPAWGISNPTLRAALRAPAHVPFEPNLQLIVPVAGDLGTTTAPTPSAQTVSFSTDDFAISSSLRRMSPCFRN
jgi:hypothetical protein